MGNSVSPSPSRSQVDIYENCSPNIAHSDIADIYSQARDHRDLSVLNHTMTLISQQPSWVWRDAQIAIYGYDLTAFVFAGDRTNKFVVHFDGNNIPTDEVEHMGWRMRMRNAVSSVWQFARNVAGQALGIGASVARNAIGWY